MLDKLFANSQIISIETFLIQNIGTYVIEKGLDSTSEYINNNKVHRKIKSRIKKFNRSFKNDIGNPQLVIKFLKNKNIINEILDYICDKYKNKYETKKDFIIHLFNEANSFYNEKNTIELDIFSSYFIEMINIINEILFDNLKISEKSLAKLVNNNTDEKFAILQERGKKQFLTMSQQINSLKDDYLNLKSEIINSDNIDFMKSILGKNNIDFKEENKLSVNGETNKINGLFTVKYDDFLSKFEDMNSLMNYLYYTQRPYTLKLVALTLKSDTSILRQEVFDRKYNGKVINLHFKSCGEFNIIREKLPKEFREMVNTIKIIPPKVKKILKLNMENEKHDIILDNIEFAIEKREIIKSNIIRVILSNKNQLDCFINFTFSIIFEDGIPLTDGVKMSFADKNDKVAINKLKFFKFMLNLEQSKSILMRNNPNGILFLRCNKFKINNTKYIYKNIELFSTIVYIQDTLELKFDIPDKFTNDDIKDIFNLKSILDTGKYIMPPLTFSINFNEKSDIINQSNVGKILMLRWTASNKYEILKREIDLGEQMYLFTQVKIKSIKNNQLIGETLSKSKEICVYKNYYHKCYDADNIIKNEKLLNA